MGKGRPIAILASILGNSPGQLEAFTSALKRLSGTEITAAHLRGIVADGREHLAFSELIAAGTIIRTGGLSNEEKGRVDLNGMAWLSDHLEIYIEAIEVSSRVVVPPEPELAWTLPTGLYIQDGPPPRSLAALMMSVISDARERLYLFSPFLDDEGAEFLIGPVAGAARRGVTVYLISHDLDGAGSTTSSALQVFRREVPNIRAFTAPRIERGPGYLIFHAKLIVADDKRAVLASANLTSYGMATHLEVGVGMSGTVASALEELIVQIIESGMVKAMPL
ncbi:MAG TPA: phospholipase D-like domain-containing protein [Pyrinomonadaceae bacterium]|jgi:phosphatidylserine/phosphatidylglycerophosphate/cardiolipin synthase-like enzyme